MTTHNIKKDFLFRKFFGMHKNSFKGRNNHTLKGAVFNVSKIIIRYLSLLALIFSLPIIYKILFPLTLYPSAFLLGLFYNISINKDIIILDSRSFIQIIPACIAGSAYLFLLILNLSTSMNVRTRINSIMLSFTILLILNILRIVILSILYHNNFVYFDFTHKLFWYILSTIFIISIWFYIIKLFSIKNIPFYTDLKTIKSL